MCVCAYINSDVSPDNQHVFTCECVLQVNMKYVILVNEILVRIASIMKLTSALNYHKSFVVSVVWFVPRF